MKFALLAVMILGTIIVAGCVDNQTAPTTTQQPNASSNNSQPAAQQQPKTKQIAVDSYNPRAVSIRNVGNETIQAAEIALYVNGELKQCTWDSETMPPYTVRRCSFSGDCLGGQKMLVMGPDNLAEIKC